MNALASRHPEVRGRGTPEPRRATEPMPSSGEARCQGAPQDDGIATPLAAFIVMMLIAAVTPAHAGEIPLAERRSGYDMMGRDTRAMQDDDTANPGMLWVVEGEALWRRKSGEANRAC